jgi:type IV pilus assembly protein PilM
VLIVAARRDVIDKILAAVRAAGLRPAGIDVAAFAMVRALHRGKNATDQVMYLSIGGLTNLAVAEGATCLFTRVAGGGLEAIAIELAERRGLTLDRARECLERIGLEGPLDVDAEDAQTAEEARAVLTDGVRRIAADVRHSLDFHHGSGGEVSVERAVLTGAAAAVPGFAEALSEQLGLPVACRAVAGAPADIDAERLTIAAGLTVEEVRS